MGCEFTCHSIITTTTTNERDRTSGQRDGEQNRENIYRHESNFSFSLTRSLAVSQLSHYSIHFEFTRPYFSKWW